MPEAFISNNRRKVKATRPESMRQLFVAPELSPVSTVQLELEKGNRDWTDVDVKVLDLRGSHLARGHETLASDITVGTTIRKPRVEGKAVVLNRTGPSARRRSLTLTRKESQ